MADHIKIRKAAGTWVVRAGGAVIAESTSALELSEGSYSPVIYIPKADIAMAFLEPTDHSSHCPWKGDAHYFSVITKSTTLENAAWGYAAPNEDVAQIADHLAFYSDKVTVERL